MGLQLTLPQRIREQLAAALLDEADLVEFLRQAPREAVAGRPEREHCRGMLPVRRALDPETAAPLASNTAQMFTLNAAVYEEPAENAVVA